MFSTGHNYPFIMPGLFFLCSNIIKNFINPLTSPSAGAPALKYGYVNIVTPSPGEAKGLIKINSIT